MLSKHVRPVLVLLIAIAGLATAGSQVQAGVDLPSRLSDAEFWSLTEEFSEENGYFRSDNFLSNETGYQAVIPGLLQQIKPGGVYMGVAPEVNFTYIASLKPRIAFIVDIRRGNLHEHLLYKALFELSEDRAEFLSKLFSRDRPAGLTSASTVDELFAAYEAAAPTDAVFQQNLKSVMDWLTKTRGFQLRPEDPEGIEYVYREGFYRGGPSLNYSFGRGGGMGGANSPTYEQLMRTTDGMGRNRSFLATEESFSWVKDFQSKNLLIPVVGDLAGPKALRAVGNYVKDRGGTVVAFYLSNVEQYLQGSLWQSFCANVATLPLDETSTFIFSGRGAPNTAGLSAYYRYGRWGGMGMSRTRPMLDEVKSCSQ